MLSTLTKIIIKGFNFLKSHFNVLLVAILVFLFPLLLLWSNNEIFKANFKNIKTVDSYRIATIHKALKSILINEPDNKKLLREIIKIIAENNPDIKKIRILLKNNEGSYVVKNALDPDWLQKINPKHRLLEDVGFTNKRDFIRNEFYIDKTRFWQVFSEVKTKNDIYYVFTEHEFSLEDSLLLKRQKDSYWSIVAILLLLLTIAYWFKQQVNWQLRHQKLQLKMRERDLFSNMIVHELRSPLTAIRGYADLLKRSKLLSTDSHYVENIANSANHLILLVNDFLEVSRLQSGKLQLKLEKVNLNVFLLDLQEKLQTLVADKKLSLSFNPSLQEMVIDTDKTRLTQVITNLVTNAIKYTETGKIEISLKDGKKTVKIRISDTGTGISASDQKKIFAPFFRVSSVDKTKITGTGLGMWITKQLVTLLAGEIGVESIKGIGTHVIITLNKKIYD